MADQPFRTVVGVVEFDPREGNAAGKTVRNITVSNAGFKENAIKIGATLWPSFDHVEVAKGDVVVLRGKFSRNDGTNKDGETITYNNLSVSSIAIIGHMDEGKRDDAPAEESYADDPADDDIPF